MKEKQDQGVDMANDTEDYIRPLEDTSERGPSLWATFVDEVFCWIWVSCVGEEG